MAGGEGTRLRPLTASKPKPMVTVVGKPCLQHVLELLRRHGLREAVVTLSFMPQAIRTYFADGEELGMELEYSVEAEPLGTAGSVRLAGERLDETFLVISGDAVCDVDLTELVAAHRTSGAAVTIGIRSVPDPLEYGIVVTDAAGRVERFHEKPSWGQVFTDTVNTGIYVIEPEVLAHIPEGRACDFSEDVFPSLLASGIPLHGHVLDGYWQDVGTLEQLRTANFDALEGRVRLEIPGIGSTGTSGSPRTRPSVTSSRSQGRPSSGRTAASPIRPPSARSPCSRAASRSSRAHGSPTASSAPGCTSDAESSSRAP